MVGALHEHRPAGRARRGLQPHGAVGPGREVGARPGRARLLPPPERDRRGRDLHLLPERRHRARGRPEAHGRLGRHVGARLQGRRLPLRPDGPPLAGRTCWPCARRSTSSRWRRTGSTARRSTSTARAGTSARWRTTRCSSRPRRASSAGPASAPSTTACATACTAAARSASDSTFEQGFGTGLETDPNGQAPVRTGLRDLGEQTDLVKLGPRGQPARLRVHGIRRHREERSRGRLQRRARGLRRRARGGHQLRRRARQRDALRPVGLQAADRHPDGRPGAHEHGVAGDRDAVAVAVVLARRHRAAALQVAGPQQLQLRRLVQPHRLDRSGVDVRLRPADGGRQRGEVGRSCARCSRTRR